MVFGLVSAHHVGCLYDVSLGLWHAEARLGEAKESMASFVEEGQIGWE